MQDIVHIIGDILISNDEEYKQITNDYRECKRDVERLIKLFDLKDYEDRLISCQCCDDYILFTLHHELHLEDIEYDSFHCDNCEKFFCIECTEWDSAEEELVCNDCFEEA